METTSPTLNALKQIKIALEAIKEAGWTSPSVMIHEVDLAELKKIGVDIHVTGGVVEDTLTPYVSATMNDCSGVTLFHKRSK